MRIAIALPVDATPSGGNGVTARRWQTVLQGLGHAVALHTGVPELASCDLLVALHARKSAAAIAALRRDQPGLPVVLAMTGTDLHLDLPDSVEAQAAVAAADRIVVLYPGAELHLPAAQRHKVRVIYQSVPAPAAPRPSSDRGSGLEICVLAHLREVKDPLCAARAVARLPATAAIQVSLAGAAADASWRRQLEAEQADNPRFTWLGALAPAAAAELLQRSDAMVISSRAEGGANVVSEAVVLGIPVLATRIDSNFGLLGSDYGGYFGVGDIGGLAALMTRALADPDFLPGLRRQVLLLQLRFAPSREQKAWAELLVELVRDLGNRPG